MEKINFDVEFEAPYLELIKEHNLISFVGALLNYGNELGLEGREIYGVHFNEDGKIEVRTEKMEGWEDDPESS